MKIYRENLRRLRELGGFSIRQLATEAGISKSTLAYLERGEKQASEQTVKKLADALNVPMEDITVSTSG